MTDLTITTVHNALHCYSPPRHNALPLRVYVKHNALYGMKCFNIMHSTVFDTFMYLCASARFFLSSVALWKVSMRWSMRRWASQATAPTAPRPSPTSARVCCCMAGLWPGENRVNCKCLELHIYQATIVGRLYFQYGKVCARSFKELSIPIGICALDTIDTIDTITARWRV
jgi:hypothetical protein